MPQQFVRALAASGPPSGDRLTWPPARRGIPDYRPGSCLSCGSRITAFSSPGHAHGCTTRGPRHHPCTYIMKRDPYPRGPNLAPRSRLRGQRVGVRGATHSTRAEPSKQLVSQRSTKLRRMRRMSAHTPTSSPRRSCAARTSGNRRIKSHHNLVRSKFRRDIFAKSSIVTRTSQHDPLVPAFAVMTP